MTEAVCAFASAGGTKFLIRTIMTKDGLNKHLEPQGLRLTLDEMYFYDTGKYGFDAYFEYFNVKKNYWGVLHSLGRFSKESSAIGAAVEWLRINKYI